MPNNPFTADIFPDGFPTGADATGAHHHELERLAAAVAEMAPESDQPPPSTADSEVSSALAQAVPISSGGRVVLLRAARAGFGKTHLLERLRLRLADLAYVHVVEYDSDKDFRWGGLLWGLLEQFHHTPSGPSERGTTLLDEVARRTFARLNVRMIEDGRVPCANPAAAVEALRERYMDLLDLADTRQAVGRWFADHFERLLSANSAILGSEAGLSLESATAWLRMLCAYTQGVIDGPAMRFESLRWAMHQGTGTAISAGGMSVVQAPTVNDAFLKEKLMEFGRLAGLGRPLVLVFDHLDMIHGQADKTLRMAGAMAEMRRMLPHSLLILSANQDLWGNTFQRFLPSALEDRLSGGQIQLGGLGRADAESLLRHRLHYARVETVEGESFLARLNLPELFAREAGRQLSPRSLLRHAARLWEEMELEKLTGSSDVAPLRVEDAALLGVTESSPAATGQRANGHGSSSFRQLKTMLDKMRQERQSSAGQPIPATSLIASPFTPVAPPVGSSGVVLLDPNPLPASSPTLANPPPAVPPVLARFANLKLQLIQARLLRVDQDRLCHLLEIAGQRLAVVRPSRLPLPSGPHPGALSWQSPDGEIIFGTEPHEDVAYWSELLGLAREKAQNAWQTHQPMPRLVVFSAALSPANMSAWASQDEIVGARGRYLDLVSLDNESLAVAYAADELLHEAEAGSLPATVDEVLTQLNPHLDFFWKRLTRPLRV